MTRYGWRNNDVRAHDLTVVNDLTVSDDVAVTGDLSVNKVTVSGKVPVQFVIPYAATAATGALLTAHDFNATGTAALTETGLLVEPPYPMQVSVHAGVAGTGSHGDTLTFVGYDAKGESVSEAVAIAGTVGTIIYSNNAFAKIASITPNGTVKSTDVGVGYRNRIGLPWPIAANTDVLSITSGLGVYSTAFYNAVTVSTTYDTITWPKAMTAGSSAQILYLTTLQE